MDEAARRASTKSQGPNANGLSYAVITAARDEADNLERLAGCLRGQVVKPLEWIIVDNGSTDGTAEVMARLGDDSIDIRACTVPGSLVPTRGAQIARAIEAGLALRHEPDVVVICDADISFNDDYFRRLLMNFVADSRLGIASGSRHERIRGRWRQRSLTGTSVEAQCRAYRAACLRCVLPLDKSMGWDSIDEAKANLSGWRTRVFCDLAFRHHRLIGGRESSRSRAWFSQGQAAHYIGYRPSYLLFRTLFHCVRDRAAVAMALGYASAALARAPVFSDADVRGYFRDQQRLRHLLTRVREVIGGSERERLRSDLLLVADAGGHLLELVLLSERLSGFSRTWVTQDKDDSRSLLRGESVYFAFGPTCRSLKNLVRNAILAWRVVGDTRPRAVVTTGAGASVPFTWVARIRVNAVIIFVEIFGSTRPSLSCRLVRPIADRTYVQWPELASELPESVYVSPWVGDE